MAMMVFAEWGVHVCEDWGEIVFTLVEHNVLKTTEHDSREDFKGGYDFFEALRRPFLPAKSASVEALSEAQTQA